MKKKTLLENIEYIVEEYFKGKRDLKDILKEFKEK